MSASPVIAGGNTSTTTPTISIYIDWASQPCRAIRKICDLLELTSKINWVEIALLKGEQFKPEYLQINPNHTVPTLVDDSNGLKMFESSAIIEYLDDVLGLGGKYGLPPRSSRLARFQAINALHNYHNSIRPITKSLLGPWFVAFFGKNQRYDMTQFEKNLYLAKKTSFAILETTLVKNSGYISPSGEPTAADVFAFMELWQFVKWDLPDTDVNTYQLYDFGQFPAINTWLHKLYPVLFDKDLWAGARKFIGAGRQRVPEIAVLCNGGKGIPVQTQPAKL